MSCTTAVMLQDRLNDIERNICDGIDFRQELNEAYALADELQAENDKLRDQLARRKCHLVKEHFGHSGGAYRMVCYECHHLVWDGMGLQEKPRYCAFCGAEVEW